MLKDNFSDFVSIRVKTPVRDECLKLLSETMPYLGDDIEKLMNLLPQIFFAVEREQWHSKLNFFLVVKGMILKADKRQKEQILERFGNLFVVAIPAMEDEPKVAITDIMMLLLPTYLAAFNKPKIPTVYITELLKNLSMNLKRADEIEASAIAVFNLVCKVYEMRKDFKCLSNFKFTLDLQIFSAFNFHKLEPVRISYNRLILEAL